MDREEEKLLIDNYNESSCFQELVMRFNLCGYEMDDTAIRFLIHHFIFLSNMVSFMEDPASMVNDKIDEESLKPIRFMNEMVKETDTISKKNISFLANTICSFILDSKHKNYFMDTFRLIAEKYPKEMTKAYNQQKTFRKFEV